MTLRNKALLVIGLVMVCIIGIIYVASRFILLQDLIELEKHNMHQNVERVLGAWYSTISRLENQTSTWAARDDTYAFIENVNNEYIKSNLVDNTFVKMGINLMIFLDSSGQTVYGKAFDLDSEKEIPISPRLKKHISDNFSIPGQTNNGGSKSGVILLEEGPMLIAAQPILTSENKGPARGTLIFGRYLDSLFVNSLTQMTLLDISMYRINDAQMDIDSQQALVSLRKGTDILVEPLNTRYIAGYTSIEDIYGNPALLLRVYAPMNIYKQGQTSAAYYILTILFIGLISGGVVMLLIERQVLSRFVRLTKGVERIATTGDVSARISISGADELTMMAETINGMLAALQESRNKLRGLYEDEKKLRQELQVEMNRRIEFTRALVHELKTPLTPVLAASDMLLEEVKEEPMISLSKSIYQGALNLNRRIDELLDLARSEIGTLSVNAKSLDPVPLLEEISNGFIPLASSNEQHFNYEIPSSLPTVWADRDRLAQVIQNILNNAIKFSPPGGSITLRAREDSGNLVVEVQDTGTGISEEDQARLFDPYHRLSTDRERFSGLGLGLALSKKLVELHKGKIWLKSKKGKGSTFGFSIPLESTPGEDRELHQRRKQ